MSVVFNAEIGANFENSAIHSSTVNFTTGQSQAEKMVLAFSTKPERTCSGTLFEILSQDERQYYKLVLLRDNELEFEFKLVQTLDPIKIKISAPHVRFCDTSRHIVYIERNSTYFIKYQVDRLAMVEQRYEQAAASVFDKPYYFYVGNNKIGNQQYHGCMSGVKFHLVMTSGVMKTVEPIREGTLSNDTGRFE